MTIQNFYNKYQGVKIQDDGSVKSAEFIQFAKEMRAALKQEAMKRYGIKLASWHVGHYDVFGFFEKDEKFIYFSYAEPRHMSIDLTRRDPMQGFLYRTAQSTSDYHGGGNNYTDWIHLVEDVNTLFDRM